MGTKRKVAVDQNKLDLLLEHELSAQGATVPAPAMGSIRRIAARAIAEKKPEDEVRAGVQALIDILRTDEGPLLWAKKDVIDVIWYLGYRRLADGRVKIVIHDRLHRRIPREKHPDAGATYHLDEDSERTVLRVNLTPAGSAEEIVREVANPKNVFAYHTFEARGS